MANCGGCSSNQNVCSCVFAPDGSTTTVVGNGSLADPIGFNKIEGPTPRPLADVARSGAATALTIPINIQTLVTMNLNQLLRDGVNMGDPTMVDATLDRITFTRAGKYLVGGWVLFEDLLAVAANNRRSCFLSQGIPAAANVWASESQLIIADNPNRADNALAPFSLVQVTVGQYMEMWVFSTIADNIEAGANAYMYAIWMDD